MAIVSVIFSIIAALAALSTIASSNGAPQQAAGAAIALCICVIPYTIARIGIADKSLQALRNIEKTLKKNQSKPAEIPENSTKE